nr:hypothetical protein [Tanacetum cinerariifolium]
VGIKCYLFQEVGYTSNQWRATKRVNLTKCDKAHSKSKDEGLIISTNDVFKDNDDHSEAFLGLVRQLVFTSTKKSKDSQRHNIFPTWCKINQDVFNVIVDEESSENIIPCNIMTRLKLTPKKHPKPYKIGWIKVVGEKRRIRLCVLDKEQGKQYMCNYYSPGQGAKSHYELVVKFFSRKEE